jgi:hypothetical protein
MKSVERGDRRAFNSFAWSLIAVGIAGAAVSVSTLHAQGNAAPQSSSSLPPQAAPAAQAKHIEHVVLDGELEVQFEDSVKGSRLLHFVKTGNKRLKVDFGSNSPGHLLSGSKVHVDADLQDDTLMLGSGGSVQVMSLPTTNTLGPQRTLVLLVNFTDNQSTPYDWTAASQTTFQTTSDFYMENSYGQTSLTGDVFGWYTIPMSSATCDTTQIATLAEQAATAQGVDVGSYPRRIYAFPQIGACSWWGLGTVGGNPAQAWINGSYTLKVVAHEWGHGLGLYHSHSQPCDPTGCTSVEYGDDHDVMGNPSADDLNAFQKERLGWLNYGGSPAITTVTASGSYALDPYETMSSGPKALKILKSTDGSGYRTWYYVEARTATGFDGDMPPGVIVHTGYESDGNSSFEFDLTPASSGATWLLAPGQSYTDLTTNTSISTVYSDSGGALVNVTMVAAPCSTGTPSVSLSGGSPLVTPGVPVSYNVAIKNTDGSTCGSTNFGLQDVVPSGWTAGFSQSPISLSPGGSAASTLTLTAPAGTSGAYGFSVGSVRLNTSGANGNASGSVTVASSLAVTTSAAKTAGGYQLAATVTAGGAPVKGVAVRFTVTDSKGGVSTFSATTSSSGVASVKDSLKNRAPSGTYKFQVTVTSGSLAGTASGVFIVP